MKVRLCNLLIGAAAVLAALWLGLTGDAAHSQTTPRPIKIVVPFAPGGATTVLARMLADQIAQAQGPTTIVENRPGGGTSIATELVARAAPDGNTLLLTSPSIIINAHLKKQNPDPLNDFEPICNLVSIPSFIVVNSTSPYRSLAELITAARNKPGELTLATFAGSGSHVAFETLKRRANVDITFVPYPGSGPAITALLGGHVTSMIDNYSAIAEHIDAGKLRILASLSRTRIDALPHIPTVMESGFDNFAYDAWFGLLAPARTPKDALARLIGWTSGALQVPEVRRKLEPLGLYPVNMCGTDFAAFLRTQYEELGRAIREANIEIK